MNAEAGRILAIAWKDIASEARTKSNFNAVAFFAGIMLLMFGMAIGPDNATLGAVASGVLWLAILLSGMLSFNRSYERELEAGALDALLLYPGDRRSIFVGKLLANLLFVALVEVIVVPVAAVLFTLPVARVALPLAAVFFLGTFGFVTLGTFYAAMSSRLRGREVLLPLLLFPMLIPLLLAAVHATAALLSDSLMQDALGWSKLLVVFDIIFLAATIVAFEYVIEG
jgi:heme exporter protein B